SKRRRSVSNDGDPRYPAAPPSAEAIRRPQADVHRKIGDSSVVCGSGIRSQLRKLDGRREHSPSFLLPVSLSPPLSFSPSSATRLAADTLLIPSSAQAARGPFA